MVAPGDCSPSRRVVSNMITRSMVVRSSLKTKTPRRWAKGL
jgi:hypothetical protein